MTLIVGQTPENPNTFGQNATVATIHPEPFSPSGPGVDLPLPGPRRGDSLETLGALRHARVRGHGVGDDHGAGGVSGGPSAMLAWLIG